MANQGEHIVALTDRKALREEDSVGPPEEDEESDIGAARKSHDKRVLAIFVVSFGVLALLSTFSAFKLLDWIYFFYALVFSTIFVSLGKQTLRSV